jgi:ferritin-like metal-binding protein YciE
MLWAEEKLVEAIPEMREAATTEELQEAFEDHLYQTQKHVERLKKVFEAVGAEPTSKKCAVMEALVKEAQEVIAGTKEGSMTRDAALIIAAQKVEHYEIASYGGLVQLAITMGLKDASRLLDRTLLEEEEADYLLTDIAESFINIEADMEGDYSWKEKKETASKEEMVENE